MEEEVDTLSNLMKTEYMKDRRLIWTIFVKLTLELHKLHSNSIIHKNLNPENVSIDLKNNVQLLNVGEEKPRPKPSKGKKIDPDDANTDMYMSPEMIQYRHEGTEYNCKTDIWSLGCLLYEMSFKKNPFDSELYETVIQNGNFVLPDNNDPDLNELLNKIFVVNYKNRPSIDDIICDESFLTKVVEYDLFEELYQNYIFNNDLLNSFINKFQHNKIILKKLLKYLLEKDFKSNIVDAIYEVKEDEVKLLGSAPVGEDEGSTVKSFAEENEKDIELYDDKIKINYKNPLKPLKKGYHSITLKFKKNLTSTKGMFYKCDNLISLNISSLNTSDVTTMSDMFQGCKNLTNIISEGVDTSKVESMKSMFHGCKQLQKLDLTSFDTSSVTDMSNMFEDCRQLTSLNLSKFDTSSVTTMESMFSHCYQMTNLNLDNFNTTSVVDMARMFYYCKAITAIDCSSFNTEAVNDMNCMFGHCENMESCNVTSFNLKKVTNIFYMFSNCYELIYLDLSNFDTKNVKEMNDIFAESENLKKVKINSKDKKLIKLMKDDYSDIKYEFS